jgi:hypothetical protein
MYTTVHFALLSTLWSTIRSRTDSTSAFDGQNQAPSNALVKSFLSSEPVESDETNPKFPLCKGRCNLFASTHRPEQFKDIIVHVESDAHVSSSSEVVALQPVQD